MKRPLLTVLVAAHDEAEALPLLHPRIQAALAMVPALDARVLYVDDGSRDATWAVLQRIAATDPQVACLRLSRNFGKEVALSAGIEHLPAGAAVFILDADGQDPPELLPEFVAAWQAGADNIYGTRRRRDGDGLAKRITAHLFYRLIGRLSPTPIPADTGDYRLLSPRAVDALRGLHERHRFMKGLFGWIGFESRAIAYDRAPRAAGASKFNFWRLWNFAIEGITSFSTAPLRLATYLGLGTALLAFVSMLWVMFRALHHGDPVAGWPSMMTVILFLGGVQLIALGMIGEYLGRLYLEAKQRPLYLIADWRPAAGVCSAGNPDATEVAHGHGAGGTGGQTA